MLQFTVRKINFVLFKIYLIHFTLDYFFCKKNSHREISLVSNRTFSFFFFSSFFLSLSFPLLFFFIPPEEFFIDKNFQLWKRRDKRATKIRKGTSDRIKIEARSWKGDGIKTDVMFNPLLPFSLPSRPFTSSTTRFSLFFFFCTLNKVLQYADI